MEETMVALFKFLTIAVIGFFVLVAVFLFLINQKDSPLRSLLLQVLGFGTAGLSTISVISPIDFIPDLIPVLGQIDDLAMILLGISSVIFGIVHHKRRQKLLKNSNN